MQLEIVSLKTSKPLCTVDGLNGSTTVGDVKKEIQSQKKIYPERVSLRVEAKGKALKDDETLSSLGMKAGGRLFYKDLGPQIGWATVFLAEYAGPLVIYLIVYTRPWIFYGNVKGASMHLTAHIAAACWSFHYAKRLFETVFVHRFSHATMPLMNLVKNCSYYWLFTAYIAYHVNHPLFTSPSSLQVFTGLASFALAELGNLSIHLALRDLRPPGTKTRKIPLPTSNPFTKLFTVVSCPNYTYEILAWFAFSIMTQCLPAFFFTVAGGAQMAIWALGKHRNYKKEFANYPKCRKAIIPYLL